MRLKPSPRNAMKKSGMASEPMIRDFALENRFISRSHMT
jgi:hypothetical protein